MTEGGRTVRTGHLPVTRTARVHLLGPDDPDAVREVWIVLHGYRQLAGRFIRRFRALDDGTRLVVAPEALSRFYVETVTRRHGADSVVGASWMTRDDREREIADYVAYLDRLGDALFRDVPDPGSDPDFADPDPDGAADPFPRLDRDAVSLTVLGFSQGVATAARWAVLGRRRPDRLVLWGDTLPPDLPYDAASARLRTMEVVSVRGEADPTRRADAETDEAVRLEAWGVGRTVRTYAGGHRVEEEALQALLRGG